MNVVEVAIVGSVALAVVGFGLATLGLFRLPGFYARAHATSKADTLGTMFAVTGAALAVGTVAELIRLGLLLVFVLVTTPTATHVIAHAADIEGYEMTVQAEEDS